MRELTAGPSYAPGQSLDANHPARQQAVAMLKSAGVRGMTVRGIAERLAASDHDIAHQTIHRWLTEEVAAGRAEPASYGRWKWRPASEPEQR